MIYFERAKSMCRLVFCTLVLCVTAAFADEQKPAAIEPQVQLRWDSVFPEISAEKQDNKWVITGTHVPSIQNGDQIVALNGKTLAADADFLDEFKKIISADKSNPVRIKLKRTVTANKRKKSEYIESFIPVRTLFDVLSSQFIISYDPINEWTVYIHKPVDDTQVTAIQPALTQFKNGRTIIGLNLIYLHDDWLFIQQLTVKNNAERLDLSPSRVSRDVLPSTKVIETCTFLDTDVPGLRRVLKWFAAESQGALYVRVTGLEKYRDHALTANESVMVRNALLLENFLKQKAEK